MNRRRSSLSLLHLLGISLLTATLHAQAPVPATPTSATPPAPQQSAPPLPDADAPPPIPLEASANTVTTTITVSSAQDLAKDDLKAGMIVSTANPGLQVIPHLDLVESSRRSDGKWNATITLGGFLPFGDYSIAIFYQGRKIGSVHLLKSGLTLDSAPTVQQEQDPLLLVLKNPSGFTYPSVRARLRIQDRDLCNFEVERRGGGGVPLPPPSAWTRLIRWLGFSPVPADDCSAVEHWTKFEISPSAAVSLRAMPPHDWFVDSITGLGRTTPQKGTLTLHFDNGSTPEKQALPLTVDLHPTGRNLLLIAFWLGVGALFSVIVRIAIPNFRRYRTIKDQLMDIAKTTRAISDEVDSMLRVQLRIERLSINTLRTSANVWTPSFSDIALRVENALAILQRRIEYTRRLDAAFNRKRLLIADELAPPTRVDVIARHLDAACEELKSDQFREQDWVFIQQELEAADKTLNSPTDQEKSAFEIALNQRWTDISSHFGFDPNEEFPWTTISRRMTDFKPCFPIQWTLPETLEDDIRSQWIKSIGFVRADLQISALELLRDFEFLAPPLPPPSTPGAIATPVETPGPKDRWANAKAQLIPWLTTPALENLAQARRLLRQLSEGIDPDDIQTGLRNCNACIEFDPQNAGPGERVRIALRFRRPNWNSTAARHEIVCQWNFKPTQTREWSQYPWWGQPTSIPGQPYIEKGWEIYHYFDACDSTCEVEVRFFRDGHPIYVSDDSTDVIRYTQTVDLKTPSISKRKVVETRERRKRLFFETIELGTALLIPLCALAVSSTGQASSGPWWQLVALGFGSDTIRNVLSAKPDSAAHKPT